MSDPNPPSPPPPTPPDPQSSGDSGGEMQRISHAPIGARVPEKVSRGVIATGFLAYFGQHEFVLDFLQFIGRPPQLAARVVMTPVVAEQLLGVLRENLNRYTSAFGAPAPLPKNPNDKPRTAQEIYDDLKIPDEQLSGVYANAVMIGHTPAEFGMDFITSFFPTAAVSARVYLAAPRVPQLIDTLTGLLNQYRRQRAGGPQNPGNLPPHPPGYGTAPGIPGFPTPPSN